MRKTKPKLELKWIFVLCLVAIGIILLLFRKFEIGGTLLVVSGTTVLFLNLLVDIKKRFFEPYTIFCIIGMFIFSICIFLFFLNKENIISTNLMITLILVVIIIGLIIQIIISTENVRTFSKYKGSIKQFKWKNFKRFLKNPT